MKTNCTEVQGVILAGGLGTRLGALCGQQPKPMAPVGDRPFLAYLIEQLRLAGVTDIILCVSHRGEVIRDYFGTGEASGVRVRYTYEPEPRGTGGALKLAEEYITSDTFVVMNGDSFCQVDFPAMFQAHRTSDRLATLALARVENAQRYGRVELDDDCSIVRFAEKSAEAHGGLVNGGIYLCSHRFLDVIPAGATVSLEHDIFTHLVGQGLYGFPCDGYFLDIGTPESYTQLASDPSPILSALSQEGTCHVDPR